MNMQDAPTVRGEYGYARLQGRRLLLVRSSWSILVVLGLVLFFANIPFYLLQLQTLCTETACEYQQLTSGQIEALKGIGLTSGSYAVFTLILNSISLLTCLAVSALIIWHRSDDRMAFIVALMLVSLAPIFITANASTKAPLLLPDEGWTFLCQVLIGLVFWLFPDGQFVPGWMRWVLLVFLGAGVATFFVPSEPLLLNVSSSQLGWLITLGEMVTAGLVQLYRYQKVSGPAQRQQTKWVVLGFAMPLLVIALVNTLILFFPWLAEDQALFLLFFNEIGFLLPLCLAPAFVFAMLRYRLWEIDTLINRTLVYGTLTLILTLLYVGLIIGLQTLLHSIVIQDDGVVVVVSTLAIAALFQPLRRRIQSLVDHRFYRSKYDGGRTLAAFSATLRDEVDMQRLSEQLVEVIEETMQPASIFLWIYRPRQFRHENSNVLQTIEFQKPLKEKHYD